MASSIVLLLLLIALALLSVSANLVSIDCGSSDSYTDENSIKWVGDDDFVQNGKSQVVQTTNGVSHVMGTLRVFSTRKKNCYSIKAEKGSQFLVRASFYYGNYDKKSAPPSFDLQLDGNYWNTIQTSAEGVVYDEVIYITKGDSIELCLAQTQPNQLPFISAIEIRGLASEMYNHVDSEYAMLLTRRVAYGATEAIRYPSDDFDRIWDAVEVGNGLVKVTTDAQTIDTSVPDEPPVAAFQYGITTSKTSEAILLVTDLPPVEVPIYIIMYFSEVNELDSTQTRSFEIYINGNGPITDGTESKDVAGLATLQDKFSILQEWTGDPCLPSPFTWDWVNCSSDGTPRVTALYLSGFGLSGQLPEFSSLDALQTIDLHNNSLSGSIPDFLGTLPNLKQLNLADNKLSGPIPTTISNNKKLKLVSSGNPNLCASGGSCKTIVDNSGGPSSGSSSKKKSSKLPLILGIAIPAFFVFWVIVVIFVCSMNQSKRRRAAAIAATNAGQNGGANMPNGLPPQGAPMNPQMLGKFGEVMMNQFAGDDEDRGTPEQGTPEQIRNQQVEERPLQY
ncbi:hypothetical protein GBA52_021108 [Prunus armeniaca]|nr:hypothetical protein GBA52_021108 [Prunus armeniaca]